MTGSDAYLPIMADCERGLGRPERALDLVKSREAERLDRAGKIELAIVESGARRDLGQHDAAVITLQRVPELRDTQANPWSARLAFAYADALAAAGHESAATDWFARAMAFDEDDETDAAERYAELTGAVIEDVEEDFDEVDLGDEEQEKLDELLENLDDVDDKVIDLDTVVSDESAGSGSGKSDVGVEVLGSADERDNVDAAAPAEADVAAAPAADVPIDAGSGDDNSNDDDSNDDDSKDDLADITPNSELTAFGPAFIEPNFGDILDDPEDREKPDA